MMLKANKYRLYPNEEQKILLEKHFGCVRLVYNLALEAKTLAYNGSKISLSYNDLASQLKDLKNDFDFLKEVNSQSLQSSLRNLDTAYQHFFKHNFGFPSFKSKHSKQSFQCPQNVEVNFSTGNIFLPKFKEPIKAILHRKFKGVVKTVTISKTPTGKYFASVLVENKQEIIPVKKTVTENTTIGIDLGLKHFIIGSDGFKKDNPKYLRESLVKLKWTQKRFSRKEKGSSRSKVWKNRVANQYEKISNQRKDFLHKVSNEITNRYDTICMEDLKVSNMVRNHKLALSISDAGWGMFVGFVKYKCEWRGKNFIQIGTFEASSKTCSDCDFVKHDLTLNDREWTCPCCKVLHDRDENAGKNIKRWGLRDWLNNWRMEHPCKDAEVSPLFLLKNKGKRAVEASKVQNVVLQMAS